MSNTRRLPNTDDGRENSMTTSKLRKDEVPADENVFSTANSTALDNELPKFAECRHNVDEAAEADHTAVVAFQAVLQKLKLLSSHGLQLLNFMIIDEAPGFTAAVREFYHMDLEGHLPAMGTEDEILRMAENFTTGETARVAAGGTALSDISKADVQTLLDDALGKRGVKQASGDALANAHTALNEQRIVVDDLIPLLWDDIEHAAQGKPEGEFREFCINWGMYFIHVAGTATLNVRVLDIDTNQIVVGVNLRIGKPEGTGGTKAITNFHGEAIMESRNFEPTFLIAEHPLLERLITPITLSEDEVIDLVIKMKKRPTD